MRVELRWKINRKGCVRIMDDVHIGKQSGLKPKLQTTISKSKAHLHGQNPNTQQQRNAQSSALTLITSHLPKLSKIEYVPKFIRSNSSVTTCKRSCVFPSLRNSPSPEFPHREIHWFDMISRARIRHNSHPQLNSMIMFTISKRKRSRVETQG